MNISQIRSRAPMARASSLIRANSSGQAVIEFILTMFIVLSMLMFIIQVTLFLSFSNFVQYATFMSGRALQSGWTSIPEQIAAAEAVLKRTVKKDGDDRIPFVAKGVDGSSNVAGADIEVLSQPDDANPKLSWRQGVRYSFKGRVFLMPLGKGNANASAASEVKLTSEGFLGREPTFKECEAEMGTLVPSPGKAIFDNGC